ncbi:MAG: HPr family phosphocarrier protein [Lachnospiraceae bacterium]|nr:HPr family phosphocarrier protein [Lachnospiraceae bacterium]
MVKEKIIIKNPTGLHLRPAGELSNLASSFQCSIRICKGSNMADAKSLLALLGSCIKVGDEVEFICEGEDEQEALAAVLALINEGLGE